MQIYRDFVEEKTNAASSDELILICGDFNVNGREEENSILDHYEEALKGNKPLRERIYGEY